MNTDATSNRKLKPLTARTKNLSFGKKLVIVGFALYITFILLSQVPYIAEPEMTRAMKEKYDYHLVFNWDGKQTHYVVDRINDTKPGDITLTYWTNTHTLNVRTENIKKLWIDCESIYYDESMKVFERDPHDDEVSG